MWRQKLIYCGVGTESFNKILVQFVIRSINCLSIILFFLSSWIWTATPAVFLGLQVECFTF